MKVFLLGIMLLFIFSCSSHKQLSKNFEGKTVAFLETEFGKAKTILDSDEGKIYVFEIVKKLSSTEVSQGKITLDPIITPKVNKTERYFFTVKEGKVIRTKYEEEYKR